MHVTCLVAAPDTRRVETDSGTWILWGEPAESLARAVTGVDSAADAVDRLVDVAQDAVAVRLGADGDVDAFRSVTATHDLYTVARGNRLLIADAFRNALAELPVEERRPAPNAVTDHLLFRHPPEPDTYVEGIRALEHGTWLHRDADGGQTVEIVDRLDARPSHGDRTGVTMLDEALSDVLDDQSSVANMLSGGVDSTLVHTYLDGEPSMLMTIDSPEFEHEEDYATRAHDLLGVDGETVALQENDFLGMLEASVDALGYPSHYNQTVLTDAAFRRTGTTTYVNAEGADALYGLNGVKAARIAAWLAPAFDIPGGKSLWRAGPGRALTGARRLPDYARWLDHDPVEPDSFAHRLPFFTDADLVGRMTDPVTVRNRHARSLEYVTERIKRDSDHGRFATQVELGQLQSLFRHNTVDQWRQLGYVHGQNLHAPFKHRRVVDAALSLPAETRYVQGISSLGSLSTKHVPKRLLADRLPDYPVYQKKGGGSLPIERYVESGPLADVFERYDPPAFVPDGLVADHVESFGPVTWNLVTWVVWRDRVLRNPSLERIPGTDEHST